MISPQSGHRLNASGQRVVLLGASNLTLALPTVVAHSQALCGNPLEILAACGHGRSFGMTSSFLGRSLPGVLQCGLWEALDNSPPRPTLALVTDVGNDLLYGATAEQTLTWVAKVLERLAQRDARLVVTTLPLVSIRRLPAWRFRLLRTVLFSGSRLTLELVSERAERLDEGLRSLAEQFNAHTIEPRGQWYGWDPIHVRRRHRRTAWSEILAPWSESPSGNQCARISLARQISIHRLRPEKHAFLGRNRRCEQPSATLADGSTLSLY